MTPERRAEIQTCMEAMTSSPSREGQMLKDLLTEIDRLEAVLRALQPMSSRRTHGGEP
jgi:hypothetical protein